jgi:DNA polymerase III subunit epsilon
MEYLIFDTETTGLPKSWHASVTRLDNWPRIVQLAWVLYDEAGKELQQRVRIVKPEGFTIPEQVVKIHGISTQRAMAEGISLREVLDEFCTILNRGPITLVAHNINFDEKIVGAELLRMKIQSDFFTLPKICTMKSTIDYCNLPLKKYPQLAELYFKLFQSNFKGAHQADADALACGKCFFELKKQKIVS